MVSEPLFEALGDKIVGFYNNLGYDASADTRSTRRSSTAWTKKEGSAPYYVQADNYLAAQLLFEAVKKADSVDPAKVKAAMNGLSFDSIAGQVTMGKDHQLVRPELRRPGRRRRRRARLEGRRRGRRLKTRPTPDPACKA